MAFFNFFKKPENPIHTESIVEVKPQTFSTPFLKIGKGNLGQPFISPFYTVSGITQFGADNLYPQILDQIYYTSAIHGKCIDFIANTAVGGGYTYGIPLNDGRESVLIYTFEKINRFQRMIRELTKDYIIHKRICVLVYRHKDGKFKSFKRVHPSYIRNSKDLTSFVWCNDWSRRTGMKTYNRYEQGSSERESLYVYQAETIGQDIYPLPTYISILNDAFLDGEIAFLQKSNIQNSIWPSIAIRVPKTFESQEEIDSFKAGISSKEGAQNAGRVMVLTGNGMDNTPEVVTISTNNNDKLFDSTLDSIMNKICIAHGLNPSIMGIKVAGSLGNSEEIRISYSIFEKNVVIPLRLELTEIFDELIDIAGIQNNVVLNNFQIIDDLIQQVAPIENKTK